MARLTRWTVAGLAHHVLLQGHNGRAVFSDGEDRRLLLDALRAATVRHEVLVHGAALCDDAVHLLLRPPQAAALSAALQTLGRRFVAGYNQRHGRSGTPWNGRFRCAPLAPGEATLLALRVIDGLAAGAPLRWSTAVAGWWVDPPELWALGNTPFERERAYEELLEAGVPAADQERLLAAVRRGLPLGPPGFLASLEAAHGRPAARRPRGRPRSRTPGR